MRYQTLFVGLLALPVFGDTPLSFNTLNTFSAGELISASKMNENFSKLSQNLNILQADVVNAANVADAAQAEAMRANQRIDNIARSRVLNDRGSYRLDLVEQGHILNSSSPLIITNCNSYEDVQFTDHYFGTATLPTKVETKMTVGDKQELGWAVNASTHIMLRFTEYCVETTVDSTSIESNFEPSLWLESSAQSAMMQISVE